MKIKKIHNLKAYKNIDKNQMLLKRYNYMHKHDENTVEITNGFIIARIPAIDVEDEFYSPKVNHIDVSDKNVMIYPKVDVEAKEVMYPKTDIVFKDAEKEQFFSVGINAKYLYELANILGDNQVILTFNNADNHIIDVKPKSNNGAYGLLMQFKIQDPLNKYKELLMEKKDGKV